MALKYKSDEWSESEFFDLSTQIAGEDLLNDVIKTEFQFSSSLVTSASTVAVKSSSGLLHRIVVGMPSLPTTILYDNTVPSGSKLMYLHAGYPVGSHEINTTFSTGLSVDAIASGGGVAPSLLFVYR